MLRLTRFVQAVEINEGGKVLQLLKPPSDDNKDNNDDDANPDS